MHWELRFAFTIFVGANRYSNLSLMKTSNVLVIRESSLNSDQVIKNFNTRKKCGAEPWGLCKTTRNFKQNILDFYPYRRPLAAKQLLKEKSNAKGFDYAQCDTEVPKKMKNNSFQFL